MKKILLSLCLILFSVSSYAVDWITVNDMSQVKWQMNPSGKVFFRNLNSFHSQALGCCYNFHIDTTTEAGKAMWSVVLTKMATSGRLILGIGSVSSAGPILYIGEW